ncbi:acetyl-CoA carboxylase biotin carboxylase subunit [Azospirillum oleiclasticum]|uniref:biotin carboxylase n=2 Tax=Azospirillum oleiclasticum TaxID=2735135 RepID=A0ABX2TM39_9PROT|nr:acetyl-CoA carboxylase biotin carboxylase subunit [Azospirillum oleiclasticum]
MKRVLIANRGEIALRAVRACRKLGLETVAVYSTADDGAAHTWAADHAVRIGPPPPRDSYLKAETLVEVAKRTGCDALYPGYGFLSEKPQMPALCAGNGLTFVGPSSEIIALMGDKVAARQAALRHGIPVVPGSELGGTDAAAAEALAAGIGYPLLLKAAAGGGGRGMRVVDEPSQFRDRFRQAAAEAESAFGRGDLYIERFFRRVRHIEVQVFGDGHGGAIHLWERDCSVQRRHQKLVEEAPSPVLDPTTRKRIAEAALTLVRGIGYVNAGTIEFIYDLDHKGGADGGFYFIEMNTRIQVEHPVTEALFGVDLVAEQFRVAAGERLSIAQPAMPTAGAALEFRINAEDPERDFAPCPGRITAWRPPVGPGIRFDSHAHRGFEVSPFYDSMIGKLIVSGRDRAEAVERARLALSGFRVEGIATTIPFMRGLLDEPDFLNGTLHTRWIDDRARART